jgi:hypothetical protein
MLQRKYLVPVMFTAALAGGGIVGSVLGAPGISFAQESDDDTTTTTPEETTPEDTTPEDGTTRDDENCPDKAGTDSGTDAEGSAQ